MIIVINNKSTKFCLKLYCVLKDLFIKEKWFLFSASRCTYSMHERLEMWFECFPVLFYALEACSLRKYQYKSINYVINSTFRKIFNTRSQETVDVRLEMFGCLKAERTIAICKRKFFKNKFSVIHNALCRVSVATAKTEIELCCTDV